MRPLTPVLADAGRPGDALPAAACCSAACGLALRPCGLRALRLRRGRRTASRVGQARERGRRKDERGWRKGKHQKNWRKTPICKRKNRARYVLPYSAQFPSRSILPAFFGGLWALLSAPWPVAESSLTNWSMGGCLLVAHGGCTNGETLLLTSFFNFCLGA